MEKLKKIIFSELTLPVVGAKIPIIQDDILIGLTTMLGKLS